MEELSHFGTFCHDPLRPLHCYLMIYKLRFTSKLPLPLRCLPIKFEAQMLLNSDDINVRNL